MLWWGSANAERATVAVATNFRVPAKALAAAYAQVSADEITVATGSTGKLYTQITRGAPFDLFLAADQTRPARLIEEDLAVAASQSTYALGKIILLGREPVSERTLSQGAFRTLAIANPKLAPYGLAAAQTLDHLGLSQRLAPKLVRGENIGQTYAMVATGNADLGIVAASMVRSEDMANTWRVPASYHAPIRQDLVLLKHGANNPAAVGFMQFLASAPGQAMIEEFGYGIDVK